MNQNLNKVAGLQSANIAVAQPAALARSVLLHLPSCLCCIPCATVMIVCAACRSCLYKQPLGALHIVLPMYLAG